MIFGSIILQYLTKLSQLAADWMATSKDSTITPGSTGADTSGLPYFLDLEYKLGNEIEGVSSKELQRPWQSVWPPRIGSAEYSSLCVTCPEAISWRFDPSVPFDRPWRLWTRSLLAKQEQAPPPKELFSMSPKEQRQ
jgi:hypothetical protein